MRGSQLAMSGTPPALEAVNGPSPDTWARHRSSPIVDAMQMREVIVIAAGSKRVALSVAVAIVLCAPAAAQQGLDKVSFGTNWVAEAEHGGHYQALVDGTYRKFGLDVTIVP